MREISRAVLFSVAAIVIVFFYIPLGHADFQGNWGDATSGVRMLGYGSRQVEAVLPATPAARAGVEPGDSLVTSPFTQELEELNYPRPGERRGYTFQRPDGTRYRVVLGTVPVAGFTWWSRLGGLLAIVPASIFFAIAFALVFLRPTVMSWSFFLFAIGYFSTAPSFEFYNGLLPNAVYFALSYLLSTVFGSFAVMPLLPFVLRFPDNQKTGWRGAIERWVWIVIGCAFVAYSYEWYRIWAGWPATLLTPILGTWLPLSVFVFAAAILIKRYKTAPAAIRQRMGYFVVGLIVSFVAYAIYFVPGVSQAVAQIGGYAVVLMPICVAYAVLRHRVLDINFVLNRAIAYGLLSIAVIAFVSLLDWSLSRIVSGERLATGIELLVTIGIGFLLDRINRGIEGFVERVLFRHRRIAEEYLRRTAAALPYATDEAAISDGLAQIPAEALRLSAAAVYRQSLDSERFEGIATSNNTEVAPPGFALNHLLVRMLQSGETCVWLDELRTQLDSEQSAIYVLAVPVTVRHELVAFTLYGAHRNGAQLDPEEVELLEDLAREASRAYDHAEAVRVRARYDSAFVAKRGTADAV